MLFVFFLKNKHTEMDMYGLFKKARILYGILAPTYFFSSNPQWSKISGLSMFQQSTATRIVCI